MTLNYWMMVERYPNLKEELGGSILGCEISSLLDRRIVMWSTTSRALALACRPAASKNKNKKNRLKFKTLGNLSIVFRGIYRIYLKIMKVKPEDVKHVTGWL